MSMSIVMSISMSMSISMAINLNLQPYRRFAICDLRSFGYNNKPKTQNHKQVKNCLRQAMLNGVFFFHF